MEAVHRRRTKNAENVAELTGVMRELRHALGVENSPFSSYGGAWDQLWLRCSSGGASLEEVAHLLSELKLNAKRWVKVKPQPPGEIGELHWVSADPPPFLPLLWIRYTYHIFLIIFADFRYFTILTGLKRLQGSTIHSYTSCTSVLC